MSQSTEHNACISLISSRQRCLPLCLESIHKYFNYKHNYPIYVHYFDDIYDDAVSNVPNVEFIQVPYETPKHISEEEMFYNRRDNAYARGFGIGRKGYLHMCHFICNMYKYPNTKLHEHDCIMVFDDDSGLVKELPFNPIDKLGHEEMAAAITGQRLRDDKPPQNHIDTRENLMFFTSHFCGHNYCFDASCADEETFNSQSWSDGYVIKTSVYKLLLWKDWIKAVNQYGGIYKHRWGDNEIMSLFYMIYRGHPMPNLGLVDKGYLNQGLFRHLQNMAPGVKDNSK